MAAVDAAVRGFAAFAIGYFIVLNSASLVIIMLAAGHAIGARRRLSFAGLAEIFHSPLAPPISVVVPVRDMADLIVGNTRGLLSLRYPEFEVIVVDDGSTDATFARLEAEFGLIEIDKVLRDDLETVGRVISVHAPRDGSNLLVVRKEGIGRRADAVNTGVNAARHPLICRADSGTYLDENVLLSAAKPFIEDPGRTIAAVATIRVANGCDIRAGRVVRASVPGGWLVTIQAAEYLRACLLGRAGWPQVHSTLFIAGTFALYRRDIYQLAGGSDPHTEGDDMEMTTSLHHRLRDGHRTYRIAFVAEPCSWTVVPGSYRRLARQRARWAQITAETLWTHRAMLFNPRYGAVGLVILPFCLIFDLVSAAVEVLAVAVVAAGLWAGIIGVPMGLLLAAAALGYGGFLTVISVSAEELTYHRYRSWRDFALLVYAAIAENAGYRQLQAWWRLRGVIDAALGRRVHRVAEPGRRDARSARTEMAAGDRRVQMP